MGKRNIHVSIISKKRLNAIVKMVMFQDIYDKWTRIVGDAVNVDRSQTDL